MAASRKGKKKGKAPGEGKNSKKNNIPPTNGMPVPPNQMDEPNDVLKEKINKIYSDPANTGGYSGLENLYKAVKEKHPEITKKDIRHFLEGNRTYTLFKNRKLRFRTSKFIPYGFMTS